MNLKSGYLKKSTRKFCYSRLQQGYCVYSGPSYSGRTSILNYIYLLNFSLYTKRGCTQIQHRPWRLVPALTARGQQRRAYLCGLWEGPEWAMPSRGHERGSPGCLHCTLFSDTHITSMWKWGLSVADSALNRLAYALCICVYICIFPWNYPNHNLSWNQMGSLFI